MMKTCIDKKLYKLTLEKMVIGVEEPVLVKGIGELVAKIDSGNSGYNVIHGEDIIVQGNIITFKTFNKDGDERRVSKKIKDSIKINIGGGHIQDRPVVELDVQFGGEDYKKVPFSITNRSDNEHKILISKDFVGNELEALIDVTKDNISNDGISVDYVTEGIIGNISNSLKKANNAIGRFADKAAEFNKRAGGEYTKQNYYEVPKYVTDEVKAISNLGKQTKEDAELIRKQLKDQKSKLSELQADINNKGVEITKDNTPVFKLLDYTGGTNEEGKNANPEYKKHIEDALKKLKKKGQRRAAGNDRKQGVVSEAVEQTNNNQQQNPNDNEPEKEVDKNDPTQQIQGQEGMPDNNDGSLEETEEIFKDLQSRNRAIFYIINFKSDINSNTLKTGEDLLKTIKPTIDAWNTKIAQGKDWSFKAFERAARAFAKELEDKGGKGLFALCTGKEGSRTVEYCFNPGMFGKPSGENINENEDENDISEFVEEYNQLNSEYLKIADDMGQADDSINADDLQALIDLANESSQNKHADELGQTDEGDSHDAQDYGYHTSVEGEERIVK